MPSQELTACLIPDNYTSKAKNITKGINALSLYP
jgi:hypothetical protein